MSCFDAWLSNREEIKFTCTQTNSSFLYESHKYIPPPKIQRFSTEALHGCSISMAQCTSNAITIAPVSKFIRSFEHLTSPHPLCKLNLQSESHSRFSAALRWLDSLCPHTLLSPRALQHSRASRGGRCQGICGRAGASKKHHLKANNLSASKTNYWTLVAHEEGSWRAT